jgi:hypothetical protein
MTQSEGTANAADLIAQADAIQESRKDFEENMDRETIVVYPIRLIEYGQRLHDLAKEANYCGLEGLANDFESQGNQLVERGVRLICCMVTQQVPENA